MSEAIAQLPGLDSAPAFQPFLNGKLPSQTPRDGDAWQLVDAFPNLVFDQPLHMLPVPGSTRILIAEKRGQLRVFENDPDTTSITKLIDVSDQVEGGGDSGFYSFAFHPEFGQTTSPNRHYLYVYYRYTPDTSEGDMAYCRLSRLTWDPSTSSIDPASEFVLIQQFDRQGWHNGGGLFFGNDGFLYLTIGDEGGANDLYNATQKINVGLHSGVFRIDVDQQGGSISHPPRRQPQSPAPPPAGWPATFSQGYYIPSDNPWLDPDGSILEEYWALGTRSPHRLTLDPPTGDIYLADVGQWAREEINLVVPGANFQWPYREGNIDGAKPKPANLIGTDTPPLLDYDNSEGSCIIGGYVYRGQTHTASLGGKYIFGDYESGRIWSLNRSGQTASKELLLTTTSAPLQLVSFGLDANAEIYIISRDKSHQEDSKIYRLTRSGPSSPEPPATLSQTGAFSDLATLTPSNGFIPYRVNSPLWSDGASKERWIAIPNDGVPDTAAEQITYSENDNWGFPIGTVIIKQFTLKGQRLETRFLVHGTDGEWFGFTYRWREDESDADLLLNGEDDIISISGVSHQWSFPSRSDCLRCHTQSAERVLGLRTRQLNGDFYYPTSGRVANQLLTLNRLGFFDTPLNEAALPDLLTSTAPEDSSATIEHRARSYLDSNCAHCHNPNEGIRAFDLRLSTPLETAGVFNAPVQNNFGFDGATEITPGDAWRSMAWIRQNTNDVNMVMPPIGRHTIDTEAVNLIYQWIESLPPPVTPIPPGLTTYLSFETVNGNTFEDQSSNGNNGQLIGGAAQIAGKSGTGIATDGNTALLQIAHSADIHLGAENGDFTVAFWVNLQESFTGSWRGLAGKGTSSNQRALGLYLRPDSNRLDISISASTHYNEGFSFSTPLPVGEWTHLTVVKEGLDMRAYFDGALDNDTTLPGPSLGTLEDFFLGRGPGGADYTAAHFDSLKIFNRALTATEVQQLAVDGSIETPAPDPETLFDDELSLTELSGPDALPEATPFDDGVSNLLKYAFNLDLGGFDQHRMLPGQVSGLPSSTMMRNDGQFLWRTEFVRRRQSGLLYLPVKSTELLESSFVPASGTETITPINPVWERVIIDVPLTDDTTFGKIRVTLPSE